MKEKEEQITVVVEDENPKTKKVKKEVKKEEKLITGKTASDVLGLNKRLLFVINKKFNSNDLKSLDNWKKIFSRERIM